MEWKPTPFVKLYEALGAVADGRVHVDGNTAKVYSSSGNKYYDITYDPVGQAIMSNDNSSYWKDYLGYPAVAFLMKIGALSYDEQLAGLLKGVPWKDINQKYKNDFVKALEFILSDHTEEEKQNLAMFLARVAQELINLHLKQLGPKIKPPEGY